LREPGLDIVEAVDLGQMRNAQFTIYAQQISLDQDQEEALPQ
jgi:hypothetical protein